MRHWGAGDGTGLACGVALTDVRQTGRVDAQPWLAERYRLLGRLGEGGMAVVWRAHDEVLDRLVAVKVLAPGQAVDAAARARVQFEARAAAALSHPNVAAVHDYGEAPDPGGEPVPFVVMELVDGVSLTDVLADGPVDPADAMRICADVAAALAAAHARGLVHRDVKPGNVIVAAGGAKLVDFGIAAAIGSADEADEDGVMLGTPAYLARSGWTTAWSCRARTCTPWAFCSTACLPAPHPGRRRPPRRCSRRTPTYRRIQCRRSTASQPRWPTCAIGAWRRTRWTGHPPWPSRPSWAAPSAPRQRPARRHRTCPPAVPPHPARPGATLPPMRLNRMASRWKDSMATGRRWTRPTAPVPPAIGAADVWSCSPPLSVLVAGSVLVLPRLVGSPSGSRASTDPQPGPGGIAVPVVPSFPAPVGASGTAAGGPDAPGSVTGPGGAQDATGTGAGVGTPGGPPAGTATGPAGDGTTPAAPPGTTAAPNPARRSVISAGGSAEVECAGTLARLISWTPAAGYETQAVQPGPNPNVQVKFRAGNNLVSIQAKCVNGVPDITVR